MSLTRGTFNLDNLFSRWNFKASIEYEEGSWPVLDLHLYFKRAKSAFGDATYHRERVAQLINL